MVIDLSGDPMPPTAKAQIKVGCYSHKKKSHIGRDRSPAGTKGAGRSRVHSATGDDSGLVSEAHRKQIQWIEISQASGPTTDP
jgi:hypothetical protein